MPLHAKTRSILNSPTEEARVEIASRELECGLARGHGAAGTSVIHAAPRIRAGGQRPRACVLEHSVGRNPYEPSSGRVLPPSGESSAVAVVRTAEEEAAEAKDSARMKDVAAVLVILLGVLTLVVPALKKQGLFDLPRALASEPSSLEVVDSAEPVPTMSAPAGPGRGLGRTPPPRIWETRALASERAAPDALPFQLEAAIVGRARAEITNGVTYANGYMAVSGYPMGDIPSDRGACTDVVVRSLRAAGIDLQKLVHEDVLEAPDYYRLPQVDTNIDHRRISTMHAYLARNALSLSTDVRDRGAFRPGDVIFFSWTKCPACKLDHVGIVSDKVGPRGYRLVLENGGPRAAENDSLDRGSIVGHFRPLARD